jgi:hypothetical protein
MASDLVTLRHIKILAQPGLADIARSSEYGQEVDRGNAYRARTITLLSRSRRGGSTHPRFVPAQSRQR